MTGQTAVESCGFIQQVRPLDEAPNPLAKEELNLLARLMGSMKAEDLPRSETGFRITLFPTDQEEEEEEA